MKIEASKISIAKHLCILSEHSFVWILFHNDSKSILICALLNIYRMYFLNQMPHSFILMSSSAWTDLWCPFSGLCKIEDIITSDLFRWIIFIILINSSVTCNRTWVCKRDREFPYSCKGTPKATQQHSRHFCAFLRDNRRISGQRVKN